MTKKCYICNRYFYDTMDLINHMKESHKTHSITAIVQYFESKLKRDKSFQKRDTDYIMSFDLEKMMNRLIDLEAHHEVLYNEEITDLRTRLITLEMKPEIVCAKDAVHVPHPPLSEVWKEINAVKSLIFSLTSDTADTPFVPLGPGSDKRTKEYLMWMTHKDKRKGATKVKTGYGDLHTSLMEELAPKLEKIYWKLE